MDINFLVGTATATTGSRDVVISGVNAAFVSAACAMFIAGAPTPVEAVEGSLTTIKLRNPWPHATITNAPFVAFNTLEGLASLMRRFATLVDQSIGVSTNFATILQSIEPTVVIDLEEGDDITVVPYGYLAANVQALIDELQESTELFAQLQIDVAALTVSVSEQQGIIDANLALALGYKNAAQTSASETLAYKNEVATNTDTVTSLATQVSTDAGLADASKVAAATSETNAAGSAVTAGNHVATVVAAKNAAELAESNAKQSEESAIDNAGVALTAAGVATTKATVATEAADSAEEDKIAAANSASAASTLKENTEVLAAEALASKNLAEQWASNPEDDEVEAGLYSALHHAIKAQNYAAIAQAAAGTVTGAMSYNGDHSAATGSFPPAPENGSAIYRVSTAGTIAGVVFKVDDFIIYDSAAELWLRLTRNQLAIADITGLQSALDGKASTELVTALSATITAINNRVVIAENQISNQATLIATNATNITNLTAALAKVKVLALAGL